MSLHFRKASYEPGVVEFGNGSFAYLQPDGGWGFSNAGLVTDGGEALLVDTMFDMRAHRRHARRVQEGQPREQIGTLVNTHHNGDDCYGNGCVENFRTIATAGAAEAMKHETPRGLAQPTEGRAADGPDRCVFLDGSRDFDFEKTSSHAPDQTFTGHETRQVGSKLVELIEVGPAHTGGDALVHVPPTRPLFTGDILFIDGHPIMWAGPVENWIAAGDRILAMDVTTIVPGQDRPVTDKKGVTVRE